VASGTSQGSVLIVPRVSYTHNECQGIEGGVGNLCTLRSWSGARVDFFFSSKAYIGNTRGFHCDNSTNVYVVL
jgi:hypothetical protein